MVNNVSKTGFIKAKRSYKTAAEWRRIIEAHRLSGTSVRAFCREHALLVSSFFRWRRKLHQPEVKQSASKKNAPPFVEVSLDPPSLPAIEIRRGDIIIALHGSADLPLLKDAVAALGALAC